MRLLVSAAILTVGVASMAWSQAAPGQAAPGQATQGQPAAPLAQPDPANFTGKVTGHPTTDIRMLRYSFEPGARTNWHSHAAGQVIFIEQGRMRIQDKGGAVRELGPRETMVVNPGVMHWHGALPEGPLTQVSLSFGVTNWSEKVTDAEYSTPRR
jgi:quercetin dioxygenase-like cupin family protein